MVSLFFQTDRLPVSSNKQETVGLAMEREEAVMLSGQCGLVLCANHGSIQRIISDMGSVLVPWPREAHGKRGQWQADRCMVLLE